MNVNKSELRERKGRERERGERGVEKTNFIHLSQMTRH